jgi:hypothetical protein
MISFCFILAIPIAIGSIEFQTRVLFNLPFHVAGLLALYGLKWKDSNSQHMVIIAILLSSATFALRAMANLDLELPEGIGIDEEFLLP